MFQHIFFAKLLCDILPLRTIPSILFSVSAYFMIGFQKVVEKYFIFLLGIFSTTLTASSLCFFVSASVRVYGKSSFFILNEIFIDLLL